MKRGRFIAFETIDGGGKSTQARILVQRLYGNGKDENGTAKHVLLTRESYDSEEINRRLRGERDPYSNSRLMARLYIKDRMRHIEKVILPALRAGIDVVCDRYKLSTIAYQSAQGLDMSDLIRRHRGMPVPNLTFFLYVPPEVAMKRTSKKDKKFEYDREFQEKVMINYLEAIQELGRRGETIAIIDGNQKPEKVAEYIWNRWQKYLCDGRQAISNK